MKNIFQMISGAFDKDADRKMKNMVADMLKTDPEKLVPGYRTVERRKT